MNPTDSKQERENRATQALIAASLHQDESIVAPAVIAKYMHGNSALTAEEEKALEKQGSEFSVKEAVSQIPALACDADVILALHRNKPKRGFSADTEEELQRKRQELQERLRKNRENNDREG